MNFGYIRDTRNEQQNFRYVDLKKIKYIKDYFIEMFVSGHELRDFHRLIFTGMGNFFDLQSWKQYFNDTFFIISLYERWITFLKQYIWNGNTWMIFLLLM